MIVAGYLYKRTDDTPRDSDTYPNLLDEIISDHIPDGNKILFQTSIGKLEGFNKTHQNKIRTISHINQSGQLSQHSKQHGMDSHDVEIFGNFHDLSKIDILDNLAEQTTQFSTTYPEGVIGLHIPKAPASLNKDCTATQGYSIVETAIGRIARLNKIWEFKCTLRFGGILKIADS